MKAFYETHQTDIPVIDRRLLRVAEIVIDSAPASVLDIACGRGTLLGRVGSGLPNAQLVGADISERSVRAAKAAGIDARVGDVTAGLPFDANTFELVVFGEVIEHIVDPDAALLEISRVLVPNGTLVLTTPNLAAWFNRILLPLGIQPVFTETSLHVNLGRRFAAFGQWRSTQGHLKVFTLDALREMLAANGYAIERIEGTTFFPPNRFELIDRAFAKIPALASNFIVVARNAGNGRTIYPELPTSW